MSATTATAAPLPLSPPAAPSSDLAGSAAERLLVIVAPGNGRFRPLVTEGTVTEGTVVAQVTNGRGGQDVCAPVTATVRGLLALPGHLVTRGQALAWAHVDFAGTVA